jgi:hypothetical protein
MSNDNICKNGIMKEFQRLYERDLGKGLKTGIYGHFDLKKFHECKQFLDDKRTVKKLFPDGDKVTVKGVKFSVLTRYEDMSDIDPMNYHEPVNWVLFVEE